MHATQEPRDARFNRAQELHQRRSNLSIGSHLNEMEAHTTVNGGRFLVLSQPKVHLGSWMGNTDFGFAVVLQPAELPGFLEQTLPLLGVYPQDLSGIMQVILTKVKQGPDTLAHAMKHNKRP